MIGGGITPIIAAGFTDVAHTFGLHTEEVALTTGLYMMGLGVGSVLFSPTAILFGKRPVYLFSAIVFIGTSLWCGFSPSFESLLVARVFQGIAVSPVECLPSATIAEIFFLHERAYRIGIYTLLLLGGKNLVPLVSAAIIGRWGWRWVFWITAMVAALGFFLLFFFVPETFWDRTPTRKPHKRPSFLRRLSSRPGTSTPRPPMAGRSESQVDPLVSGGATGRHKDLHVGFASESEEQETLQAVPPTTSGAETTHATSGNSVFATPPPDEAPLSEKQPDNEKPVAPVPAATGAVQGSRPDTGDQRSSTNADSYTGAPNLEKISDHNFQGQPKSQAYTHTLRQQPPRSFAQQLKPYNGRLNHDKWFKVMLRPFVLFAYPAVLWSSIVYACSVGWLIVISETMAIIYRDPDLYNFDALQTGLVYISPFIGGILGTGVAGKISDIIVKAMSKRNGGMYEPEFRLVMAIPILLTTCIGLMGFGWSAEEEDHWIVPTLFFGVMSFGCSLGSTTAITFCVDSYRQYAGEALVTLNFSKNILHGLVFSLFVTNWLATDGAKAVFIWIGIIQLILMLFTIPMYIYGKRARMWTARMNLMERL
jgi:MFS family permease